MAQGTTIQVLAIDPGKSGALVWIGSDGQPFKVWKTPLRGGEIDFLFIEALLRTLNTTAKFEMAIEKQQSFGRINSASKVMQNYGGYLRCLRETDCTFTEIPQVTWKAAYKLLNRGRKTDKRQGALPIPGEATGFSDRNKVNKAASLALANLYWPSAQRKFGKLWTSDAAEAALIGRLQRSKIIERSQ